MEAISHEVLNLKVKNAGGKETGRMCVFHDTIKSLHQTWDFYERYLSAYGLSHHYRIFCRCLLKMPLLG